MMAHPKRSSQVEAGRRVALPDAFSWNWELDGQGLTCFIYFPRRQVSLFHLFDGQEYLFDVPHYQRPYSWQTKHVFEMLHVGAGIV